MRKALRSGRDREKAPSRSTMQLTFLPPKNQPVTAPARTARTGANGTGNDHLGRGRRAHRGPGRCRAPDASGQGGIIWTL